MGRGRGGGRAWHDEEFGAVDHLQPRPALKEDIVGGGTALDFAALDEQDAILDVLVAVLGTRHLRSSDRN